MSTDSILNPEMHRFLDLTRSDGTMIPGIPVPCPFCGQDDSIGVAQQQHEAEPVFYFALCEACYTRGPSADTHLDAAVAWNKRSKKADPNETSVDFVVRPGDDHPELMLHALAAVTKSIEPQDITADMDRAMRERIAGLAVAAQMLSGRLAERIA